jgi:hypothetical protein
MLPACFDLDVIPRTITEISHEEIMKIDPDKYLAEARESIAKAEKWRTETAKALHEVRFARAALSLVETWLANSLELERLGKNNGA